MAAEGLLPTWTTRFRSFKIGNETPQDMVRLIIDMTGKKVGLWTVLRRGKVTPGGTCAYWLCRCACGREQSIGGTSLRNGTTMKCRTCSSAEVAKRKKAR